eukprot:UN21143
MMKKYLIYFHIEYHDLMPITRCFRLRFSKIACFLGNSDLGCKRLILMYHDI